MFTSACDHVTSHVEVNIVMYRQIAPGYNRYLMDLPKNDHSGPVLIIASSVFNEINNIISPTDTITKISNSIQT